jgi:Zn-dependent peptidase ImmA (M78 family)
VDGLFDLPAGPRSSFSERVRLARHFRGESKLEFAGRVGVSRKMIGQYESGESGIHGSTLEELADQSGFPKRFFDDRRPLPDVRSTNFRVRADTAQYERDRIVSVAVLLGLLIRSVAEHSDVLIPEVKLSDIHDDPVDAARKIRALFAEPTKPIDGLLGRIEALGVLVTFGPPEVAEFDAYSAWVDGRPVIVLNPEKRDRRRIRFDLAHELGHLVLHREPLAPSETQSQREDDAHRFARALLAPHAPWFEDGMETALRAKGLDKLDRLSEAVGMEVREMVTYIKSLRPNLTSLAARRMAAYNARGALAERRPFRPEVPSLLADMIDLVAFDEGVSASDLAYREGVPQSVIAVVSEREPTTAGVDPHR